MLTPQQINAIVKLGAKNNIARFAKDFFRHHLTLKTPAFHKEIYDLITDDTKERIAIAAPRGSSKSTIVSLIYVIHSVLYKKAKFVLIISDSYKQSVLFLETIKSELENNEKIKILFGNQKSDKWSEGDIELKNGTRIIAKGQSMKVRGLKYQETRPDLVILDDLENQELVESDERREKLGRWFAGELLPALDMERGRIIYIGTILHYDSLLNQILNSDTWETRIYKAIEDDKPLWEERYSKEKLAQLKEEYSSKGLTDLYFCEYMNDPITNENAEFKQEWFKHYEPEDIRDKQLNIFTTVDLAISKKEHADYTAIVTLGVDRQNNAYILEIVRKRLNPPEVINELFRINKKYKPEVIGIETVAYQKAMIYFLREEMERRNHYLNLRELKADTDKERRIRGLIGRYQSGKIYHRYFHTDLEEELLRFPKGATDDIADAMAYQLSLIRPSDKVIKQNLDPIKHDLGFEKAKYGISTPHWLDC